MFKNMIARSTKLLQSNTLHQTATKNLFLNQAPKRWFSSGPVRSTPGLGAMFGLGLGVSGLAYLMYYGRQLSQQRV